MHHLTRGESIGKVSKQNFNSHYDLRDSFHHFHKSFPLVVGKQKNCIKNKNKPNSFSASPRCGNWDDKHFLYYPECSSLLNGLAYQANERKSFVHKKSTGEALRLKWRKTFRFEVNRKLQLQLNFCKTWDKKVSRCFQVFFNYRSWSWKLITVAWNYNEKRRNFWLRKRLKFQIYWRTTWVWRNRFSKFRIKLWKLIGWIKE